MDVLRHNSTEVCCAKVVWVDESRGSGGGNAGLEPSFGCRPNRQVDSGPGVSGPGSCRDIGAWVWGTGEVVCRRFE